MASLGKFLYLSRSDVERLDLPMEEIVEAVHFSLEQKARGRAHMPPKHWVEVNEHRFLSAMTGVLPELAFASCKWQCGSSRNHEQGLPYITGLLVLNELQSGLPVALMDSTWLTAERTAASSAVAARALAKPGSNSMAIIGCGVQGRTNLRALLCVRPELSQVYAYDIDQAALDRYAEEMQVRHQVRVIRCRDAHEAVSQADVVVTCGPIEPHAERTIEADWLKPGALGVALDYDCYWKPAAMAAMTRVFTDDLPQLEHLQEYGYFLEPPEELVELSAVLAGTAQGRESPEDRLLAINMGVAVEDVATAARIYALARDRGTGTWLAL